MEAQNYLLHEMYTRKDSWRSTDKRENRQLYNKHQGKGNKQHTPKKGLGKKAGVGDREKEMRKRGLRERRERETGRKEREGEQTERKERTGGQEGKRQ